jgi:hypothetical protein
MNEPQLIRTIKAHIERGDRAKDKADQHYIAAGQHLKALKEQHEGSWAEWEALLNDKVGIGKSRASELMQIADGRKTVDEVRDRTADSVRESRARQVSPLRSGETSAAEGRKPGVTFLLEDQSGAQRRVSKAKFEAALPPFVTCSLR